MDKKNKLIYFISDRTGITSEGMGEALLTQFDNLKFKKRTYPFVDSIKKAQSLVNHINEEVLNYNFGRPIIFSSIVKKDIREIIKSCEALHIDFYDTFINTLEEELETSASEHIGKLHSITNQDKYESRIKALNFTLNHDDGISNRSLDDADIILIGVSRSGKTPTCLYLALQYGIRAANYPLTPDDLECTTIPKMIAPYTDKLFGLTIDAEKLHHIRMERRANSDYSSLSTCYKEVEIAENLFNKYKIPFLSTTHKSIEELAAAILVKCELKRKL